MKKRQVTILNVQPNPNSVYKRKKKSWKEKKKSLEDSKAMTLVLQE